MVAKKVIKNNETEEFIFHFDGMMEMITYPVAQFGNLRKKKAQFWVFIKAIWIPVVIQYLIFITIVTKQYFKNILMFCLTEESKVLKRVMLFKTGSNTRTLPEQNGLKLATISYIRLKSETLINLIKKNKIVTTCLNWPVEFSFQYLTVIEIFMLGIYFLSCSGLEFIIYTFLSSMDLFSVSYLVDFILSFSFLFFFPQPSVSCIERCWRQSWRNLLSNLLIPLIITQPLFYPVIIPPRDVHRIQYTDRN